MPILDSIGSARGFGAFIGKKLLGMWTSFTTIPSESFYGNGMGVDSSNNIYFGGFNSTSNYIYRAKMNSAASLQWDGGETNNDTGWAMGYNNATADSSGNLILAGFRRESGTNFARGLVIKYDTNGNRSWSHEIRAGSLNVDPQVILTDSSNNVYLASNGFDGSQRQIVYKLTSSGTYDWGFRIASSLQHLYANCGAIDSSGNFFVGSPEYNQSSNIWYAYLIRYNSSGTIQWQKRIYKSPASSAFIRTDAIATDSSGNCYAFIRNDSGTYTVINLLKFNTSGTLQFQKEFSVANASFSVNSVVSNGTDIFVLGLYSSKSVLIKMDTNGNIIWQKEFVASTGSPDFNTIRISSSYIYLQDTSVTISGNQGPFMVRIPISGDIGDFTFQIGDRIISQQNSTVSSTTSSITIDNGNASSSSLNPSVSQSGQITNVSVTNEIHQVVNW